MQTAGFISEYLLKDFSNQIFSVKRQARRLLHKNATGHIEQILEVTSLKTAAVRLPTSHL